MVCKSPPRYFISCLVSNLKWVEPKGTTMNHKMSFSTMAPEHKIGQGDPIWSAFNASFVNQELELIDIANQIYLGHPFTTWHKNNWRNNTNFQLGGHIALDFDSEDTRSTLATLKTDFFIAKYAALIYTTPSHTVATPRARVLFLLDQPIQQAANYTSSVSALLWLFGTADRQCKDACRFFYGSHHCEVEWLDNVLPLEKVKQIIHQYKATGDVVKRAHEIRSYTPTADQQEVAAALKTIQPWSIDYDEWLKILMAIHQSFGDSALPLAEQWASGADGEVRRKWRSFKADGNGTGTVTLNTVFKMAIDRGWSKSV